MPLNRHDWAAIHAKVAFIAMLKCVLVECGVISYEILFAKTVWFLGFLGVAVSLAGYAQACSTPALTGAHNATVPTKSPGSALFELRQQSAVLKRIASVNVCQWFGGCC